MKGMAGGKGDKGHKGFPGLPGQDGRHVAAAALDARNPPNGRDEKRKRNGKTLPAFQVAGAVALRAGSPGRHPGSGRMRDVPG